MLNIGITGQAGFIGTHLYNTLGLFPEAYNRIPFKDVYFENEEKLNSFVKNCDVIVHLAALNRHNEPEIIYQTNIKLVKQLIVACEATKSQPYILFSSSTQEERDNVYGKSKKEGRIMFAQWAKKNNAFFSGLIIPNVFGPFGNPYYNSVIATFCHQLTHAEQPKIDVDAEIKLIYVQELVQIILDNIEKFRRKKINYFETTHVPPTAAIYVSKLLEKLNSFRDNYFTCGIIPCLDNPFERNLFNTFVSYIDHKTFFPFFLKTNTDNRGTFVETIKLHSGGQVSFSTTKPGITRGNHYHTRKAERFAVIKGKAKIEIRRIGTDKVYTFLLDGEKPSFVDMPVWFTHNITNIGDEEVFTIFWINEHYNPNDPDTFFENVRI